jgi:hypothetical protein
LFFREGAQIFSADNTQTGLMNTDISCPPENAELFQVYFSYLWRSGFLLKP